MARVTFPIVCLIIGGLFIEFIWRALHRRQINNSRLDR
ncbi:MAG TPA: protein of unknown function (UPF0154) [Caudoviricetes sp.]|nr:MAG TPA: protein of unknown function (UPF0154) [Caudoviricetes sp.]